MGDEKPKAVFTGDLIHADGSVDPGVEGLLIRGKGDEKPSPGPWRWRWEDRTLVDASGRDILFATNDAERVYADAPADAALIAAAPAMLELLRADAALIMDLMNSFMARESRECPCCENRGGALEDGSPATHAPFCRLLVRFNSLRALLDKHGRKP